MERLNIRARHKMKWTKLGPATSPKCLQRSSFVLYGYGNYWRYRNEGQHLFQPFFEISSSNIVSCLLIIFIFNYLSRSQSNYNKLSMSTKTVYVSFSEFTLKNDITSDARWPSCFLSVIVAIIGRQVSVVIS